MNGKQKSMIGFLIALSAFVGWEVRPVDIANLARDEFTIIHKNLDKSCFYEIHRDILISVCPKNIDPHTSITETN